MFGNELALAIALLVAPVGSPVPDIDGYDWLQLQSAIHRTAIVWEIMDPSEKRYLFDRERDLLEDLDRLRTRREALLGAPKIADADRFPARHIVQAKLEENRTLKASIEARQALETDRASLFRVALYELDELRQAWQTLAEAKSEVYHIDARRSALKKLLALLGEEAYAAAQMPPAVPEWRLGR